MLTLHLLLFPCSPWPRRSPTEYRCRRSNVRIPTCPRVWGPLPSVCRRSKVLVERFIKRFLRAVCVLRSMSFTFSTMFLQLIMTHQGLFRLQRFCCNERLMHCNLLNFPSFTALHCFSRWLQQNCWSVNVPLLFAQLVERLNFKTRDPWNDSSHRQNLSLTLFTVSCIENTKIKKKDAGNGPFSN